MSADLDQAPKRVVAVCGKGGVGKTAVCALLSRVLLEAGVRPLLLVDADPVGGLVSAIGERAAVRTLGDVRSDILSSARGADEAERSRLAEDLDYLVMEALLERDGYSVLAMGKKRETGCFCPVNKLLRGAIDLLIEPFSAVLIDAEAGIEQVNRKVTRRVTSVLGVTDGSARSAATLDTLALMAGVELTWEVRNRALPGLAAGGRGATPAASMVRLAGEIPEDETLRRFDAAGRSLWELPADNPALAAARRIAREAGLLG